MDLGPSFTLHLYYIRSNTFTAFSQQILGYKLLHALIWTTTKVTYLATNNIFPLKIYWENMVDISFLLFYSL